MTSETERELAASTNSGDPVFLADSDRDLYKEVIKLFAVFLGGLGSGFGIKSYLDREK